VRSSPVVIAFAGVLVALFTWLRPSAADRLLGGWSVDEAAWAASDADLAAASPGVRESALAPPRRTPLHLRFGPGPEMALSMGGHTRRGTYRVLELDGDRVTLEARFDGVVRRLMAVVGWGRCRLDVGAGRPLPMVADH